MDKENVTDLAETAFEILTSRELIHSNLKKEKNRDISNHLSLRELLLLVGDEAGADTKKFWNIVNASPKLISDVDTLLERLCVEKNHQLAAAASDDLEHTRQFDNFSLSVKKSNKDDGSAYLIIKFLTNDKKLYSTKSLFLKEEGKYQFFSLPKPVNGSIQLLLRPNHPVIAAIDNIASEFYLK
jgi:hypothetical protein